MFNSNSKTQTKNMINSWMNFLPIDNRAVTSFQIVEDYQHCPKNYTSVHRTYDQDSDADLYKENILFGKKTTRYLCLSKTEGIPEFIVETLRVIGEKEIPPEGFQLLTRTADSGHKPWRKKQIVYKLSKRGLISQAVTDVILCSKLKQAPAEFKSAGEINGILVCYKTGTVTHRSPPSVPNVNEIENGFKHLGVQQKPLPPIPKNGDYENISSYQNQSPITAIRPEPKTPVYAQYSGGTSLGAHAELEGVTFILNPNLNKQTYEMPKFTFAPATTVDYDFSLERQILCTTKSNNINTRNPFFNN